MLQEIVQKAAWPRDRDPRLLGPGDGSDQQASEFEAMTERAGLMARSDSCTIPRGMTGAVNSQESNAVGSRPMESCR